MWRGFKNAYQIPMFLEVIRLRAQSLLTNLDSIVNILWGEGGGSMLPSYGTLVVTFGISYQLEVGSKIVLK